MGTFERYLTVWVALGIIAGVGLGLVMPGVFQALAALDRTARSLFNSMDEYWYSTEMRFANFDIFVDRAAGQTYNGHDRAKVSAPPIRAAFEKSRQGEDYVFNDLMRVRLYRGVRN